MPASTEINAPNLNSRKHSLMDPRGICREPLPFPSSFFIYFTLFFCSFFDCGTDFLIIRLRITRPVGEDDFFHSFLLLFLNPVTPNNTVSIAFLSFRRHPLLFSSAEFTLECFTTRHVRVTLLSPAVFSLTPRFCIKAEAFF